MQTTTTNATAAPTCKPAGITLPCPCCGNAEAAITVNLSAQADEDGLTCLECSTEFSLDSVRDFIAKWTKVANWLDAVPQFDAE